MANSGPISDCSTLFASKLNSSVMLGIFRCIFHNIKSFVLTSVESKLQEMKTSLVSVFDKAKTYVEAVHKPAIIMDSSCTDEEYFNITTDTTSDANSSQIIPKTVYPSASSSTITERERPMPKRNYVHVTDRDERMIERNNRDTQNGHRQLNITFFSRYVGKEDIDNR